MIQELSERPQLLCALSYLFVEFHHLPGQRANLTQWGLPEDLYEIVKTRIHAAMDERPQCRLQIYWRSFWGACGDVQRFMWISTPQASDKARRSSERHTEAHRRARNRRQA
jgi:hypothetical protein